MQRRQRVLHLRIWIMLAGLVPAVLVMALVLSQHRMPEPAPLRLSDPVAVGTSR